VTTALDNSFDNVVAILENWSRAIQFRDGLSHVFRGEASYSPDFILGAVERLTGSRIPARERKKAERRTPPVQTAPAPSAPAPGSAGQPVGDLVDRLPKLPLLPQLLDQLKVDSTVEQLQKALDPGNRGAPVTGLLDYLLKP
jgi:hypothetical protein